MTCRRGVSIVDRDSLEEHATAAARCGCPVCTDWLEEFTDGPQDRPERPLTDHAES